MASGIILNLTLVHVPPVWALQYIPALVMNWSNLLSQCSRVFTPNIFYFYSSSSFYILSEITLQVSVIESDGKFVCIEKKSESEERNVSVLHPFVQTAKKMMSVLFSTCC